MDMCCQHYGPAQALSNGDRYATACTLKVQVSEGICLTAGGVSTGLNVAPRSGPYATPDLLLCYPHIQGRGGEGRGGEGRGPALVLA